MTMTDPHRLDAPAAPPLAASPLAASTLAESTQPSSGSGRIPGLDGLRALAVVAVVVFHLNPAWLPGGFLGVDIFFVVSGFLITTLLVREHARTGRLDLPAFWARRARRLLPALLVVIPFSVLLAWVSERDLLVGIGPQVLGALTFSFNWVQIAAGSNYFAATSPQLLTNLWSLAVEEQFYLAWPLITLGLLTAIRSARSRIGIVLILAAGSGFLMAARFDPEVGATRVYYGTDTHVFGLMIGAALALWWTTPEIRGPAFWIARRRAATALALGVLAGLMWWLDESRPLTFRGGLVLASVASAVLIASAITGGTLARALDLPALRWIGERSYGIYLWHWPVILVVNADYGPVPGSAGFGWTRLWCVVVILALADLCYRLVELPVRRRGWRGAVDLWARQLPGRADGRRMLLIGATTVLLLAGAALASAPGMTSAQQQIVLNEEAATRSPVPDSAVSEPRAADFSMPTGEEIDAYGDSMMVGSVPALKYYFPGIRIDAKSNRRWSSGYRAVLASRTDIRRAVVLSFGTNAGVTEADVRATLDRLGSHRMIVLVNVHLNSTRASSDNAALKRVAADYRNVVVADWSARVRTERTLLQSDGIHPSMTGQHAYAAVVRQTFADLSVARTGIEVRLPVLPIP